MRDMVRKFMADTRGQGFVEYGLMLALIAVVLITTLTSLNGGLKAVFQKATDCLNASANGSGSC